MATTEAQHNAGRYAFTFPGGVFTVRREPHDDEKDEGLFMQESFKEVTDLLDQQGAPDAKDGMRVWIKIAPTAQPSSPPWTATITGSRSTSLTC